MALPFFLSHIHVVASSASLDTSSIFATPFSIRNDGLFSIYSVECICNTNAEAGESHTGVVGIGFTSPKLKTEELRAGDAFDIICPVMVKKPTATTVAELQIVVSYQAKWTWKKSLYCGHFVTAANSRQQLLWLQAPVAKCVKPLSVIDYVGPSIIPPP